MWTKCTCTETQQRDTGYGIQLLSQCLQRDICNTAKKTALIMQLSNTTTACEIPGIKPGAYCSSEHPSVLIACQIV